MLCPSPSLLQEQFRTLDLLLARLRSLPTVVLSRWGLERSCGHDFTRAFTARRSDARGRSHKPLIADGRVFACDRIQRRRWASFRLGARQR